MLQFTNVKILQVSLIINGINDYFDEETCLNLVPAGLSLVVWCH